MFPRISAHPGFSADLPWWAMPCPVPLRSKSSCSQGVSGERAGLHRLVGHLLPCRAQSEGEGHGDDQEDESNDEQDDQGCFSSSGTQILAKEIELLLDRLFCEKEKWGVRPLPFPGAWDWPFPRRGQGGVLTVGGHGGGWTGGTSRRRLGGVRNPVV